MSRFNSFNVDSIDFNVDSTDFNVDSIDFNAKSYCAEITVSSSHLDPC